MEEHVYDKLQGIELDCRGYSSPINRSNQTQKTQQDTSVVKEGTPKRCLFLWIGILIGSVVSGLIIFSVMQYGLPLSDNGSTKRAEWSPSNQCNSSLISEDGFSCFWTEWTTWTGCNSLLFTETEKRVQIYTGYAKKCLQEERVETRTCNDNVSSCFWTEWTSWTPCKSSLIIGKQTRVQLYTGYSTICKQNDRFETQYCYDAVDIFFDRKLDIRFDPTTLYSNCYLSKDLTILSNRYTDRTPYYPGARSRFKKYQGAMVNTCVENSATVYYEVYFKYVILTNMSDSSLVFELGIAEPNKIDNYHYVGIGNVSGWSIFLYNCERYNKVCLEAQHQPHGIYEDIKLFSSNTAGTNVSGTFGILLDRERNKFALFYDETVLFTFNDVFSNVSLCPVFGVYNPHIVQVDLQILSFRNLTLTF